MNFQDSREAQTSFMEEHGMTWPQAREAKFDRPIHDLYRVDSWPVHWLIDEDGVILE